MISLERVKKVKQIVKKIQQMVQPEPDGMDLFELALYLLNKQGGSSQLVQKEFQLVDTGFRVNSWYLEQKTKKLWSSLLENQEITKQIKAVMSEPKLTLDCPFYETQLIYEPNYLILEFFTSHQTTYNLSKTTYQYISRYYATHLRIMITSDFKIFYKLPKKEKWVLLTLSKFFNELAYFHPRQQLMLQHLLEFLGTKHLLFLDLVKEAKVRPLYLPYTFQQVFECQTKRELLQLSFKNMELPKRLNKEHLHIAYLLMKAKKYVPENQWVKLFEIDFSLLDFYSRPLKGQLYAIFSSYYHQKLNIVARSYESQMVQDFVLMMLNHGKTKQFNLNIQSYRRLLEEHDRLSDQLREKETPVIKIPKDSRFKKLKLPKEFEEIKTRKRLIEESRIQRHCVWSYANKINRDQCRIYSIVRDGERYTLEVVRRKDKFVANQIRGKGNQLPPKNLENEVCQLLKEQKVS